MGILRMFLLLAGVAFISAGMADRDFLLAFLGGLVLGAYCYLGERGESR